MKLKILFILIILQSICFSQQLPDRLFERRFLHWEEISYNSSLLISEYYKAGQHDSLGSVLEYWEGNHGITEPIMRFQILKSIYEGNFYESNYPEVLLYHLLSYRHEVENTDILNDDWYMYSFNYAIGYSKVPYLSKEFNILTISIANQLKMELQKNSIEYLFCEFYSNNFDKFFESLKKPIYQNSTLKKEYDSFLDHQLNKKMLRMTGYSLLWYPLGKNKLLGNHPELGFTIGGKNKRIFYDFVLGFRFLNSKNDYIVKEKSELFKTDHFFGGYFGLEGGLEAVKFWRTSITILTGLTLDGFDTLPDNDDHDGKSILVLNKNIGVGFRYYLNRYESKYIGFQLRYNFVDYNNKGGTDLSGNVITFRIHFGIQGEKERETKLKYLKY